MIHPPKRSRTPHVDSKGRKLKGHQRSTQRANRAQGANWAAGFGPQRAGGHNSPPQRVNSTEYDTRSGILALEGCDPLGNAVESDGASV